MLKSGHRLRVTLVKASWRKVDISPLVRLFLRVLRLDSNGIHSLEVTPSEVLENGEDALVADVVEHPRDAEADTLITPLISRADLKGGAKCLSLRGIVSSNRRVVAEVAIVDMLICKGFEVEFVIMN